MKTGFFVGMVALLAGVLHANAADTFVVVDEISAIGQAQDGSNGLPNPTARFQPDSTNFTVIGDLLVWCAQESGSETWAEVINTSGSTTTCDVPDVRFDWNAGFRVSLGYGMGHDQWDTQFYYTWFRSRGNDHVSSAPGTVFSAFLGNFYVDNSNGSGVSGVTYQKASIDWTIHFSMLDWELGRAFLVSRKLSLRPYVGLKGGWIHQSIHSEWHNPDLSAPKYAGATHFNTGRENLKNNFWGIGPSGGLSTKWNVLARQNHAFSLFGDFSGAIMYGHWTFGDVYKNDIQQEVLVKLSHLNSGATMMRTVMGFGWDVNFYQDRFHFSTKLGYEMQFWLDQLQFYSFETGRLSNELTLQGGTLDFCFDF